MLQDIAQLQLEVLRFYNIDIFKNIEWVMEVIYNFISKKIRHETK